MQEASIQAHPQYVHVELARNLGSVQDAQALHAEVEAAFATVGIRRVLFDYRKVGSDDSGVREAMWSWTESAALEAVAVVVDGELGRVRLNMTALSKRLPLRAFVAESDAVAWLVDPEQRRPTREMKRG